MLTEKEIKVLRYLAVHSKECPSINKIAKECKITPNGTYKILRKFENEGILSFKQISNIKSYYIDFGNRKSLNILELALTSDVTKKRIKYRIEDLKGMEKITEACILFGSYISDHLYKFVIPNLNSCIKILQNKIKMTFGNLIYKNLYISYYFIFLNF